MRQNVAFPWLRLMMTSGVALAAAGSTAWAQSSNPETASPAGDAGQGAPPQAAQPASPPAPANETLDPSRFAVLAQATLTDQGVAGFRSPYQGPNSLDPVPNARETVDATLYVGWKLWRDAEVWVDPEIDQGFGLSDTLGLAGFASGEAYKVGETYPYFKIQRAFLHQIIDLGGESQKSDLDQNQFAQSYTADRLVLWVGKMSVGDVFDNNQYTLDPRNDFLNWSIINAGTFDYAANAWGYTYGAAAEWYVGPWTARLGVYDMSTNPNGEMLDRYFGEFQLIAEGERRYALLGQSGVLKVTGYDSRARMGDFADAIRLSEETGAAPSVLLVRRYRGHAGISANWAQQITSDLGVFGRVGLSDGHQQSYEFTDINRTAMVGLSITGQRWRRPDDAFAAAFVANGISKAFQAYLNDGGLGILVGDGKLPHPGAEQVLETYYSYAVAKFARVTFDYQLAQNPAYNTDRGPVSIFAVRVHLQSVSALFSKP
jgi:high affinity Mn2+ porin